MTLPRKPLFAAMAILLGLTSISIVLEVALRLFPPPWLEGRMRELNAGEPYRAGSDQKWPAIRENGHFRQFVPGSTFMVRHYEYEHAAQIDELGGRATPHDPGYEEIVPFLGDSFTFGLGVGDSETFVALLASGSASRRSASRRSASRLVNLGVPGSALHDQLNILEMRHAALDSPKRYVFVLFMGNDLTDVRKRYEHRAHESAAAGAAAENGWLWRANTYVYHHPVLKRLYAPQYLRQKALMLMPRGDGGYMRPVFLAMRSDLTYLDDSLEYFRKELGRLAKVSRARDFRVLFVLIPDVHQLDGKRRVEKARSYGLDPGILEPERLTRRLLAALDDFRIPRVNLEPCLAEGMTDGLFYVQDNHFTAAGHALAAECLRRSAWTSYLEDPAC